MNINPHPLILKKVRPRRRPPRLTSIRHPFHRPRHEITLHAHPIRPTNRNIRRPPPPPSCTTPRLPHKLSANIICNIRSSKIGGGSLDGGNGRSVGAFVAGCLGDRLPLLEGVGCEEGVGFGVELGEDVVEESGGGAEEVGGVQGVSGDGRLSGDDIDGAGEGSEEEEG